MKLEINNNKRLVVNDIELTHITNGMADAIHGFLYSHYLISKHEEEIKAAEQNVVLQAEALLAYEDVLDEIADLDDVLTDEELEELDGMGD